MTRAVLVGLALLVAACAPGALDPLPQDRHPVRQANFWTDYPTDVPLERRVYAMPSMLADYIARDNLAAGVPGRPRPAASDEGFRTDVAAALAELPPEVKALVAPKLIGVFLGRNLGSSGYAEMVDGGGAARTGIVALDVTLVDRNANDWATWRANNAFLPGTRYATRVTLATPADDTRRAAIQFILLHEFAHLITIDTDILPDWTIGLGPGEDPCRYQFMCFSWQAETGGWVSRFETMFPLRRRVVFYRGDDTKLTGDLRLAVYRSLSDTNLPSLFGATSPHEDFAESFAIYVHTRLQGRPYRHEVTADGAVIHTLRDCFADGRCPEK